jgi:hypothetical protein
VNFKLELLAAEPTFFKPKPLEKPVASGSVDTLHFIDKRLNLPVPTVLLEV